jgi:phosphoribosylformimino-5-aminoimidazole carboxamide ribotide isomerase
MIVFPAIDLRHGRCVRLQQGRPEEETVFGDDPVAVALRWVEEGAEWLHIVNLDGAFGQAVSPARQRELPINLRRLADIRGSLQATSIQFGGGIRSLSDIQRVLSLGATRVILGTAVVHEPELVADAIQRFGPSRIVAGIDAREGKVATHGWQRATVAAAVDVGLGMQRFGVTHAVYTDITRDGMLTGLNVDATVTFARATGLRTIASGGVAGLADVARLKKAAEDRVEGIIIGRALYTGAVTLKEAFRVAAED